MPTAATQTRTTPAPTQTAPAPSQRVAPAPSHPSSSAAPARKAARPAVRLQKQPPRTAAPAAERAPAPAQPSAVADRGAAQDPNFGRVIQKLDSNAARLRKHDPAAKKAAEAQAASRRQPKERLAKAQEHKVEELSAAEGKKPEPDSFLELLRAEIEKLMPKKLGEIDDFMDDDQKRKLKGGVTGNIDRQKEAATGPVKTTAEKPPDTASVPERPVEELPEDALPQPPVAPLNPGSGMPPPKPDSEVSLEQSKADADRQLEEAEVTPEQLKKANDPRFDAVLKARGDIAANAAAAPPKYRASERATLTQAAARAVADERRNVGQMKGARGASGAAVKTRQQQARERDEARRREVTESIERMFTQTKEKVEGKLASLETEVSTTFDRGIEEAMTRMKNAIDVRKNAWKRRRYDRIGGGLLWIKDKLLGLPDAVKVFYEEGQKLFTKDLDALIVRIAALVEQRLREAKDEVALGQRRIADYVGTLEDDLKAVGRDAQAKVAERFDELRQGIDDKKRDLARNLAQRYKDARDKADQAIKEMREADKGLLVKLAEKIGEIVRILREFKAKIMGMLRKGKDTIALIVADPIGFLKNLLAAVKKGFGQFVDRIEEHMKAGFAAWLFGSLAGTGIEMPTEFSLPALFKFVLQVLGVTPASIRARVAKVIGERNMELLEKAWAVLTTLIEKGPGALWEMAKEYVSDLKEKVIDAAREWLVGAVIKAATTRLLLLFNPVGAIIQAIMMIYNTVMFFIERINQILMLVEAIIESVAKIAVGEIGAAADWIEKSLARAVPVIIAFLARLLGLSGLAERVKDFITRIQTRVANAIDKVIAKVVGGLKKGVAGAVQKVAGWLGLRKSFQVEGESHSLYFQKGQTPKLLMASEPMPVAAWADKRKEVLKAEKKFEGKMQAAYNAVLAADKRIGELVHPTGPPPAPEAQEKEVNAQLDRIAAGAKVLGVRSGPAAPVPPMVVSPPFSSNKATSMTVRFLFNGPNNHKEGQNTSGNEDLNGAWAELASLGIVRTAWVSGHMLNADMGGLPVNSNLIPIRRDINKLHDTRFDSKVKKNLYADKKVIWMKFTVERNHPEGKDPNKLFVSRFRAEAAEMPYDARTNRYAEPSAPQYEFDKSGAEMPYPFIPASSQTLNDLIKVGKAATNKQVNEVAKSVQLPPRLVRALVDERGGTPLGSVDDIKAFIEGKENAGVWTSKRAAGYKSRLEEARAKITL